MRKHYTQEQISDLDYVPGFRHKDLQNETHSYFLELEADSVQKGTVPMRVHGVGNTLEMPDYHIWRNDRPITVCEYVSGGTGYVKINGVTHTVKRGDVYLLEAHTTHEYWADRRDPFTKLWINFFSPLAEQIVTDMGLRGVTVFHNTNCEDLFLQLLSLGEISNINEHICYQALEMFMQICVRLKRSMVSSAPDNSDAERIKHLLDLSVYEKLSLTDICGRINMSKSYVINTFKAQYNTTPHRYLLDKKLTLACDLLKTHDMPISDISDLLGFYDYYHFSNAFKTKFGISPSQYREKENGRKNRK